MILVSGEERGGVCEEESDSSTDLLNDLAPVTARPQCLNPLLSLPVRPSRECRGMGTWGYFWGPRKGKDCARAGGKGLPVVEESGRNLTCCWGLWAPPGTGDLGMGK